MRCAFIICVSVCATTPSFLHQRVVSVFFFRFAFKHPSANLFFVVEEKVPITLLGGFSFGVAGLAVTLVSLFSLSSARHVCPAALMCFGTRLVAAPTLFLCRQKNKNFTSRSVKRTTLKRTHCRHCAHSWGGPTHTLELFVPLQRNAPGRLANVCRAIRFK